MLEAAFGIPVWQNVMEDMRIQHEVQPVKQWVKLHDKHPDTEGLYLVCDQYGDCDFDDDSGKNDC